MLKLIVNADDFGLSERINEGISIAYTEGILTSTSIMACGKAFDHAVDLYRTLPTLDTGVHLTLVEEQPVASLKKIPSLLLASGRFRKGAASFVKAYMLGQIDLNEVALEFEAQICKIKAAGVPISHIDTHQHLHMLPGICKVAMGIAEKHNIPAMRIPYEKPKLYMLKKPGMLPRFMQLLFLNGFCSKALPIKLVTPDHFVGFFHSGRLTSRNLKKILLGLPSNGACELICHPGAEDSKSLYFHWKYRWEEELKALTHPEIKRLIAKKDIKLSSYGDLADSP